MPCLTCGAALSKKDRSSGCRRCAACRQQAPGRPAVRRYADRPRVTVVSDDGGTWWLEREYQEDRGAFQREAARRHPKPSPNTGLVLNHPAFDGMPA